MSRGAILPSYSGYAGTWTSKSAGSTTAVGAHSIVIPDKASWTD